MNHSKAESTQEKLRAISQFTGRVVHDLNNFSTIFINVCELLKDDLEANEEGLLKLKMIEESANKLLLYTQDLNNLRLRPEKTESVADVNHVIDSLAPTAQVKIIKSPLSLLAKIDSERLKTILASLIANSQEASGEQEIMLEAKKTAAGIEITVQDHGEGMSEEQLSRLCEPYYTSKQNVKGAGLSLTKAFSWLDNIGGSLSFESAPGQGTIARVSIPEACERQVEILLVDDQDPLRKLAAEILRKRGFTVLEAANGVSAWELAERQGKNISVLITDVNMPEMDGRELAKKLHERFNKLKVLFMSGYSDEGSHMNSNDKNTAFLSKPFNKDLLLKAVDKILQ